MYTRPRLAGKETVSAERFVMTRQEQFSDELIERFKAKLTPAADGKFLVEDLILAWHESQE